MGNRGCKKNFLKTFRFETQQSESEHYISYPRWSLEEGVRQQRDLCAGTSSRRLTKSWVVAYTPKLMRMFHCHTNVELCVFRVGGIKYLLKNICKVSDRVTIEIVE